MAWRWRNLSVGLYVPLLEFNLLKKKPTGGAMSRSEAYRMIQRRAIEADVMTKGLKPSRKLPMNLMSKHNNQ